jgi:hypothetical protein
MWVRRMCVLDVCESVGVGVGLELVRWWGQVWGDATRRVGWARDEVSSLTLPDSSHGLSLH